MGFEGFLVIALALPPVWLAGGLWWYVTHSGNELSDCHAVSHAFVPVRFEE